MASSYVEVPGGIFSLLDTDLYKFTMQSVVFKYFKDTIVTYSFTNRTPAMRLTRGAFKWLQEQVARLGTLLITTEEMKWLRKTCPYLSESYLHYLESFRLRPQFQVKCEFNAKDDTGADTDVGDIGIETQGLWVETILYETLLLALTSEAYFKFCDRDWTYDGQLERAKSKGLKLLQNGCLVSEFGSRRRRDYRTHDLVMQGLAQAQAEATEKGYEGKITGTSNVHLAMKYGMTPVGTMAHEWFMGIAAATNDYAKATETALGYWYATFGRGVLSVSLTDTFGTPQFLKSFRKALPANETLANGHGAAKLDHSPGERYVDVFNGVRQDSGDPLEFVEIMRRFCEREQVRAKKTIVFSDSLNVDRCIEYKEAAEQAGFQSSFGIGTFFTNDFVRATTGEKSPPMNIVIKLSSANGEPAVKLSDNMGKTTGDVETVDRVKKDLGYVVHEWSGGNERTRWDAES